VAVLPFIAAVTTFLEGLHLQTGGYKNFMSLRDPYDFDRINFQSPKVVRHHVIQSHRFMVL